MKTHPASELSKLTLMALACMPAPVASCATKVRWWQKADNGLQWWMMTLVTLSGALLSAQTWCNKATTASPSTAFVSKLANLGQIRRGLNPNEYPPLHQPMSPESLIVTIYLKYALYSLGYL